MTEVKALRIKEPIVVDNIRIEPTDKPNTETYLVLYDNCELHIRYKNTETGIKTTNLEPIETNNTKLVWQKAQQQQD